MMMHNFSLKRPILHNIRGYTRGFATGVKISDVEAETLSHTSWGKDVGTVKVTFSDNHKAVFHTEWLIDHDPAYIHPESLQRQIFSADLKTSVGDLSCLKDLKIEEGGSALKLKVDGSQIFEDETHTGEIKFSAEQLRSQSYSDLDTNKSLGRVVDLNDYSRRFETLPSWNAADLASKSIPQFSYNSVANKESSYADVLKAMDEFGVVIVTEMPQTFEEASMKKTNYYDTCYNNQKTTNLKEASEEPAVITEHLIRSLFGSPRETHYGRMWDTAPKSENQPINDTAYTKHALHVHTDGAYWHDMAGLQVFHCVAQSNDDSKSSGSKKEIVSVGDNLEGCTRLCDGFQVMKEILQDHPKTFEFMAGNKLRWMSKEDNVFMQALDFPFRIGVSGEDNSSDVAFRYNGYDLAALTWLDFEKVEEFYEHNRIVFEAMRSDRNVARIRLNKGDMIILNNQRVCHGREAFSDYRSLVGCYVGKDDWVSRLRLVK